MAMMAGTARGRMDDIAYRLGFGARRRAELAAVYRDRAEREWLWRPPPVPRRRRRRGRLSVHFGCLSWSVPFLAVVAVLAGWWMG